MLGWCLAGDLVLNAVGELYGGLVLADGHGRKVPDVAYYRPGGHHHAEVGHDGVSGAAK